MIVVQSPRHGGRTSMMLAWMKENPNYVLLVHSEMWAETLRKRCPDMKDRIFSWDLAEHKLMGSDRDVIMEDVDLWIARQFGIRPRIITIADGPDDYKARATAQEERNSRIRGKFVTPGETEQETPK